MGINVDLPLLNNSIWKAYLYSKSIYVHNENMLIFLWPSFLEIFLCNTANFLFIPFISKKETEYLQKLLGFISNSEPAFRELKYLIRETGNLATIAETRPNGAHKQFVSLLKCE